MPSMVSPDCSISMEGRDLSEMIAEYTREAQTRDKLLKTLINIYEAEIQRLRSMGSEDHLSGHQKATIKDEISHPSNFESFPIFSQISKLPGKY